MGVKNRFQKHLILTCNAVTVGEDKLVVRPTNLDEVQEGDAEDDYPLSVVQTAVDKDGDLMVAGCCLNREEIIALRDYLTDFLNGDLAPQ